MLTLIRDLWDSPTFLPVSSKFIFLNGMFYLMTGLLFIVWPGAVQTLLFESEFVGRESALVRVLGLSVAVIGWFYIIGGGTGARQFVAASVLNRITLVPAVLIPLALSGVFPTLLWIFAVLDPAMGVIAWNLLAREKTKGVKK